MYDDTSANKRAVVTQDYIYIRFYYIFATDKRDLITQQESVYRVLVLISILFYILQKRRHIKQVHEYVSCFVINQNLKHYCCVHVYNVRITTSEDNKENS